MKKKLLLIALPALMALSGCANIAVQPVEQNEPQLGEMFEDTTAHEEIFGEAVELNGPSVKMMGDLDTKVPYKVGYQIHFDDKGTTSGDGYEDDDTISIRFVAAITGDENTYETMTWHRGLARGDGEQTLSFSDHAYNINTSTTGDPLTSSVIYHSVSNGDLETFTAGESPFEEYTGFIVYCLNGIPYKYHKDSFLAVKLTLHPSVGDDVVTSVYAVKVEKNASDETLSAYSFSFPNDTNSYFLHGFINSNNNSKPDMLLPDANPNPNPGDNNKARYPNVVFASSDYFGSFYFNGSDTFKYFSYSSQVEDDWSHFDESYNCFKSYASNHGFATPVIGGTYSLYVSNDGSHYHHIYTSIHSFSEALPMYLNLNNWDYSSAKLAIYKFNNSTHTQSWEFLSTSTIEGGIKYYTYSYSTADQAAYPNFIILRLSSSTPDNLDKANWPGDGNVWNKTHDLSIYYGPGCYVNIQNADSFSENFPVLPF